MKIDITYDNVCLAAIRHEGLWRVATEGQERESDWIPSLEIALSDAKMGALLALMMDGNGENQTLLDEALSLLSLEEVEKLTKAGLIP